MAVGHLGSVPSLMQIFNPPCSMGNRLTPEIRRQPIIYTWLAKLNFCERFTALYQNLQDVHGWKYREASPLQLLETLNIDRYTVDRDELERAYFFWTRKPRLLQSVTRGAWVISALGIPICLFKFPMIGGLLLVISLALANLNIVHSARWRRQYELSIHRLLRRKSKLAS
jgi:hypothetical protein